MAPVLHHAAILIPFGLFVGVVGSLSGVGGGFLMVPFLLLAGRAVLGRSFSPETATGTSLALAFLNAAASSITAGRLRRIDVRTGILFALLTLPGAYGGRIILRYFAPAFFAIALAILLLGVAVYLVLGTPRPGKPLLRGSPRELTESTGETHRYEVNRTLGCTVSFLLGFLSSMFGVGGGFIHTSMMVLVFGMPVHVATATSQFTLSFTSGVGAIEAATRGKVDWAVFLWIGLGVVAGGRFGVFLAKRLPARVVRTILGVALVGVAATLVART